LIGNLRIRKLNALLMIGSVVSVLAIIVINFQLHTFKRKGKAERDYVIPEIKKVDLELIKTLEWFKTRGISKQTLR